MIGIIDTHTHILDAAFAQDQTQVIQNAWDTGVRKMLVVATSLQEAQQGLSVCETYPWIDLAVGFHPTDLLDKTLDDLLALESLLQHPRVVALGEIGLDYYWDSVPRDVQKEWFQKQMELANRYQKPVLIHMRDATKDTLDLLKQYQKVSGLMHCYTGSVESAAEILSLGLDISLAGPLTFKNANHLLDVAKAVPLEHLFVETDAPYLTPAPHRGKRNEPAYVLHTLEKLCDLKEMQKEQAMQVMWTHYHRLFHGGKENENLQFKITE
ncbi:MAG: TatD family hydrolase [Erysipelotrichaceae bacterium]